MARQRSVLVHYSRSYLRKQHFFQQVYGCPAPPQVQELPDRSHPRAGGGRHHRRDPHGLHGVHHAHRLRDRNHLRHVHRTQGLERDRGPFGN